ncbi:hypothetical protein SAMN05216327_110137 [Dyadobacter sp. SG02]|uniref:hypothetical protein n=1 Tax=Dyadobacter sp. SG02 TaxID=1855291 RepID=UPI0008B64776|nr:hypothetical protein [Dyadobacter sp. SG02]SEJ44049.1 hypothetical protein SAMN05216327_110137 [Dyadobacter sp. SG02]
MKHLLPIILILSGIFAQSCIDCGPQAELSARIYFTGDSLKLDSVYALNAVSQEAIRLQTDNFTPQHYYSISLPISLVSDTTTYVFRFTERIDTLSIYYQRIFRYKGGCGFITDAKEPTTPSRYYSTFAETDIHYDTFVNTGLQPWINAEPAPGMSIFIRP